MPIAICRTCGKEVTWRNQRGTRLRDLRCYCGGTIRQRTPEEIQAATESSWRAFQEQEQRKEGGVN